LTEDVVDNVIELYPKDVFHVLRKGITIYTEGEIVKDEIDFFSDT